MQPRSVFLKLAVMLVGAPPPTTCGIPRSRDNPGVPGRPEPYFSLTDRFIYSQTSHAAPLHTQGASLDAVF